jgi:hypothetical protein
MRNKSELPRLSLKECDRRWVEVRKVMKEKDLDCLLLCGFPSNWDSTAANARFISQIGGERSI